VPGVTSEQAEPEVIGRAAKDEEGAEEGAEKK
jgi:hypothetical protein